MTDDTTTIFSSMKILADRIGDEAFIEECDEELRNALAELVDRDSLTPVGDPVVDQDPLYEYWESADGKSSKTVYAYLRGMKLRVKKP